MPTLLFVPIAMERGRRATSVLERSSDALGSAAGVTVLVGVDGSAESDQAVRDAARLFGPAHARIVLAAEAEQADALIIGRRGRGLSHRLLGSVAHSLARHASIRSSSLERVRAGGPLVVIPRAAVSGHGEPVV